ncbi:MAG: PDZ domain-containing protein [Isosphaeraceae bacterium]
MAALAAACLASAGLLAADDLPAAVRYTLKFPAPQTHYVEVAGEIPAAGSSELTLMMPVWTPGSYLVREYARNVEDFRAVGRNGAPLKVEKTRKNRWRVETEGNIAVRVSYRVYCREMGVQTSWVDGGFALLNGAGVFMTPLPVQTKPRTFEVQVELPPGWKSVYTGLAPVPGGGPNRFLAPDFDTLVDCPIYAGNPTVYEFQVDGKPHLLVNEGEGGVWDGPRSARDVETIVRTQRDFWGFLPYDRYVFLNLMTETGGGLEHKNSTVLMTSRFATRTRKGYLNWLELVSHEYFHAWNVKRLRPVELGPFDYESEVHTRSLWVAEGLTDYFGRLLVRRAGLNSVDEYLAGRPRGRSGGGDGDEPVGDFGRLQTTPGRLVQPLETASYDAWIKFYRPDENSANTGISYYTKGSVVGFLLDAEIRRATSGARSLDDVMRRAYERYSGPRGFTPAEFRAVANEVAGTDLSAFFHKALETTDELDYSRALDWFGLRFKSGKDKPGDAGKSAAEESDPPKGWLGLTTKNEGGRLVVSQVKRETPAFQAGLNVGDEILAIGDDRVRPETWKDRAEMFRPGESVTLLVSRRDRLTRLVATFGREPERSWSLAVDQKADATRQAHRKAWLGE